MQVLEIREGKMVLKRSVFLAALLLVSVFSWAVGAPLLLTPAHAANLTQYSDTISDSDLGVVANHTLSATTTTALDADDQLIIEFDPSGGAFDIGTLESADFTGEVGLDVVAACGGGPNELSVTATTSDQITLTVCTSDTVAAGNIAFTISNGKITNPGVAGSYVVRMSTNDEGVAANVLDTGDTRVVILNDVVVTASVDTVFTFTVSGLATSTDVNGSSTTGSTTPEALSFGTLTANSPVILGQELSVTSNAANGFSVTVVQDQNLQSATGADIDLFIDGAETATPAAWQAPAGTLGTENTYGHFGLTSEDSTLVAGDEFGSQLYAGNFNSARQVFYHTGPADGTTADQGLTQVAYQIEIDALQEAGNDYTNSLTYVATPTF